MLICLSYANELYVYCALYFTRINKHFKIKSIQEGMVQLCSAMAVAIWWRWALKIQGGKGMQTFTSRQAFDAAKNNLPSDIIPKMNASCAQIF